MIPIIQSKEAVSAFLKVLVQRGDMDEGDYAQKTKAIVKRVKEEGDKALFDYTSQFDSPLVNKETVKLSQATLKTAYDTLGQDLKKALALSAQRITAFHEKQKQKTWLDISEKGEMLGQRVIPLETVGIYVPGGKAAYPSSVLMNALPAKVAGVKKIVMVTPCSKDLGGNIPQNVLAAAYLAGVDEVYTIGGAQAVAALAFGTETIPKVDKIVGPGNIYVALAKREVYGYVSIDSIAGPSEILIIADESANPKFVAADLLSQAEHDELASSVLITNSEQLAQSVCEEVESLYKKLNRKNILKQSLKDYSRIIITESMEEACKLSNQIAPEHLELATDKPFELLPYITSAGAIFLGHYTPEPVGDYMAGPNHVLPTNGTARFFSPLSVEDYVKKSSLLSFSKASLRAIGQEVITFAESEYLDAHALSVKVRMEEGE